MPNKLILVRNILFVVVVLTVLGPAKTTAALRGYCGDQICSAAESEDCWSCAEDCYGSEGCFWGDGQCAQVEEPGGIYECTRDCGECVDTQDCRGDDCCGFPSDPATMHCCGPFEMCDYSAGECVPIPMSN